MESRSSIRNKGDTASRQRRLVLSEEDYTSTLSSIVQRDYFPEISQLERQSALLECRSRGDSAGAVAVRRATRQLMEHEEAMATRREEGDRDVIVEGAIENNGSARGGSGDTGGRNIRKRPRPLNEETLTGFHARVTNEDDEEFDSTLKQEIQENRQRLEGFFQPIPPELSKPPAAHSKFLLEMASDDFAPESNQIAASEWNKPPLKNSLFFNPTPLRGETQQQTDDATKLLSNTAASDPTSVLLMLPPSESQTKDMLLSRSSKITDNETSSLAKSQLVEFIPKHHLEKKIDPSQTRFPTRTMIPLARRGVNNFQRNGMGLLAPSDTEADNYLSSTDTSHYDSTDLDGPLRPIDQERELREKRIHKQQRQQQSYVAMTPQIIPGAGNQSPITTWGTVDETPLVLSGRNPNEKPPTATNEGSSFQLAAESQREQSARQAESELLRRSKQAKQASAKARKNSSKMEGHTSSLTPAAMTLLQKTQRVSSRSRAAFGSALRTWYTPQRQSSTTSDKVCGTSQLRTKRDHAYNATPQL